MGDVTSVISDIVTTPIKVVTTPIRHAQAAATEFSVRDNSNLTTMMAGALSLGLMLVIISNKRKSRTNHYK